MEERIKYMEKLLGDSADKHSKELKSLRDAHSKHAQDLEDHHVAVEEHIKYVGKLLGDSTDKHAKELQALRDAHDKHVKGMESAAENHATVEECIKCVEKMLGDSADKHARELEALNTAHGKQSKKQSKNLDLIKALHARHATMGERIDYIEKLLGNSADKHSQELQALKDAHDERSAAQGKHAKDIEVLKALHAHYETMGERVDNVERWMGDFWLGDSADKHAAEIQALKDAHAKFAAAHERQSKDVNALKELCVLNAAKFDAAHEKQSKDADASKELHAHHATKDESIKVLEEFAKRFVCKLEHLTKYVNSHLNRIWPILNGCLDHMLSARQVALPSWPSPQQKVAEDTRVADLTTKIEELTATNAKLNAESEKGRKNLTTKIKELTATNRKLNAKIKESRRARSPSSSSSSSSSSTGLDLYHKLEREGWWSPAGKGEKEKKEKKVQKDKAEKNKKKDNKSKRETK